MEVEHDSHLMIDIGDIGAWELLASSRCWSNVAFRKYALIDVLAGSIFAKRSFSTLGSNLFGVRTSMSDEY